jgi:excisionase family DNA binding protein
MEQERMLTLKQVAERLQVSLASVRRWVQEGDLRGVNLRGKAGWRITERELQDFLDTRRRQP